MRKYYQIRIFSIITLLAFVFTQTAWSNESRGVFVSVENSHMRPIEVRQSRGGVDGIVADLENSGVANAGSATIGTVVVNANGNMLMGTLKLGDEKIPLYFKVDSFRRVSEILASNPGYSADFAVNGVKILTENMHKFKDALIELQAEFGGDLADRNLPLINDLINELESATDSEHALATLRKMAERLPEGDMQIDVPYDLIFSEIPEQFKDKITDKNLQELLQKMFFDHIFMGWFCHHMYGILIEGNKDGIFEYAQKPGTSLRGFLFSEWRQQFEALHPNIPDSIPSLYWCRSQILFILNELVKNIFLHTRDEEPNVIVKIDNNSLIIEVQDRGPGMSSDQIRNIELLCSSNLSGQRGPMGGYGIGLFNVTAYAEYYNGHFEISNRDGGGIIARVVLPLKSLQLSSNTLTNAVIEMPLPNPLLAGKVTVIVDSNSDSAQEVKRDLLDNGLANEDILPPIITELSDPGIELGEVMKFVKRVKGEVDKAVADKQVSLLVINISNDNQTLLLNLKQFFPNVIIATKQDLKDNWQAIYESL